MKQGKPYEATKCETPGCGKTIAIANGKGETAGKLRCHICKKETEV